MWQRLSQRYSSIRITWLAITEDGGGNVTKNASNLKKQERVTDNCQQRNENLSSKTLKTAFYQQNMSEHGSVFSFLESPEGNMALS